MRSLTLLLVPLAMVAAADSVTVEGTNFGGQPVLMVRGPAHDPLPPEQAHRLRQMVTVTWQDMPVSEACDHLARLTQSNIVVDPELRADSNRIITLDVADMRADRVLEWIRTVGSVYVTPLNGGMYVSLNEPKLAQRTAIYPVGDLVHPIQDFAGPSLSIPEGGQGGGIEFPGFDDPPPERMAVEDLAIIVEDMLNGR